MRRRPDSITTRLCPHYRFQKGRQKILNYDTVDTRRKHHTIVAPQSSRGNCENGRVMENKARGILRAFSLLFLSSFIAAIMNTHIVKNKLKIFLCKILLYVRK